MAAHSSSQAANLTGDPRADGWNRLGNALDPGIYIRGGGGWSFDVYRTAFVLAGSDALVSGNWEAGDQIIGLGGVMTPARFIFRPNLVAKFGSATATFSASSVSSPNGNGNGSFTQGMAGLGGVQVDLDFEFESSGDRLRSDQITGSPVFPDAVIYDHDGSASSSPPYTYIDEDFGRVLGLFSDISGQDALTAFEVILNLTYLADSSRGGGYDPVPIVNGRSNMALQRNNNDYTDALVVPELPVWAMVPIGLFIIIRRVRRDQSAF
jgi:hypothetical protein